VLGKIGDDLQTINRLGPYGSSLAIVLAPKFRNIFEVGLASTDANYVPAFLFSFVHDRNTEAQCNTEPSVSNAEPTNPFDAAREVQKKSAALQSRHGFRGGEVMRSIVESK